MEKEDKWAAGAATDLEGEHQSFASLLGAETDEEPEVVEESLMVSEGCQLVYSLFSWTPRAGCGGEPT